MNTQSIQPSKPFVVQYIERKFSVSTHSMFGGTGYFQNDAMFLLLFDGKAYLRGGEGLSELFKGQQCQQFAFKKRIGSAVVEYFAVDEIFDSKPEKFEYLLQLSVKSAQQYKHCHTKTTQLRNLPNLQLSIERMLFRVGIEDCETLHRVGSVAAYSRLKEVYGEDLNISLLWKLEGALSQVHYTLLSHQVKCMLLNQLNMNQGDTY
ncbi:TfoX/Sxy family DNA transformation protein [Vibrio gallicus]|uniref:TfoX/Sxy family DNA transformation protein n=1 Tax=Vibrio gallicus TaxID=190897 RepID=UPI0021C33DAB|nr:TfoX/Sxy family DNA transformation protein [Vibrio gallicus]